MLFFKDYCLLIIKVYSSLYKNNNNCYYYYLFLSIHLINNILFKYRVDNFIRRKYRRSCAQKIGPQRNLRCYKLFHPQILLP